MQIKIKSFSEHFTNRFFENTFVSFEVRQSIILSRFMSKEISADLFQFSMKYSQHVDKNYRIKKFVI